MVDGACLLVVMTGRLGRHGTGLVEMLNEVPAAVEHEFGPPAVQCESQNLQPRPMNGETITGSGVSPRARAYGLWCVCTRATPHGMRGSAPACAGSMRVLRANCRAGAVGYCGNDTN